MSNLISPDKSMLCDADCVDYDKHCIIRDHLQSDYCYYKKRKNSSVVNNRKEGKE